MTSAQHRESMFCRNCGAHAPDNYCPRCGQETSEHLPTAFEFVHEFVLHYFAAEGHLWRTLRALVLHPGRLTIEYLKGRKLAYVLPLRLYLTISVILFLLLKFSSAAYGERAKEIFHRILTDGHSELTVGLPPAIATLKADGSFSCQMPGWLCARVQEIMLGPRDELERRLAAVPVEVAHHVSAAMFVLLPLFAACLFLAYRARTYGEHFVFALHVHSFWFLMLTLLLLPMPLWLQRVLQMSMGIYAIVAMRAVYGASWPWTLLKGSAVLVTYGVALFLATALLTFGAFVA